MDLTFILTTTCLFKKIVCNMKLNQNGLNQRFWIPSNHAISYLKKQYKRFNTPNDWTAVKLAKNTVKGSIRSAKNNFFHKSSINLKKSRKSKTIIYGPTLKNLIEKENNSAEIPFLEENGLPSVILNFLTNTFRI